MIVNTDNCIFILTQMKNTVIKQILYLFSQESDVITLEETWLTENDDNPRQYFSNY